MSRFDSKDRNLIIDCNNDLPSNVSDELAFLSFSIALFQSFLAILKCSIFVFLTTYKSFQKIA